jgi:hypothetical protein
MQFPDKTLFLILIFLFSSGIVKIAAQNNAPAKKDSVTFPVDSTKFFKFNEEGFPYGNSGYLIPIQNKLDNFQNYHRRQAGLGNDGSPEKELALKESPLIGFCRGTNNFSYFGFLPENKTFYFSERPYTKLQYILGQKQELNVSVIHAHPFGKNCNVAFGFSRIRSTGFYQRQNTNNTSVDLNGWYRSPGRRYALLSDIYWTSDNVAENGGIANDSDFDFAHQLDRHLVGVNLAGAQTRQRMRGAWLKEYWSFGTVIDTVSNKNDSIHVHTKISPSWAIVHTISISDQKYSYKDQNPEAGFYSNVFRDTTLTSDSTYMWKFENGLWLERFDLHNINLRSFFGKIGVKQETGEIKDDTIYRTFSNFMIDGKATYDFKKTGWKSHLPRINVNGIYTVNGYNKGDYSFKTQLVKLLKYEIVAEQSRAHPDFLYTNYSGNHFRWERNFSQSTVSNVHASLFKFFNSNNFFSLSAGWFNYDKPVYLDQNSMPAQFNGSVNALTGKLFFVTGTKKFRMSNEVTWNKIPYASPIRLPEFVVRESVYADFLLFKSALRMQTGVDFTWYSAYYADAYNPAISQFYVQNSKSIGNYIYLDPFVSIKVKPVHIFIKADHLNAGWFGRKYYQIPHYPGNDFALKFGLSWVFND